MTNVVFLMRCKSFYFFDQHFLKVWLNIKTVQRHILQLGCGGAKNFIESGQKLYISCG